jgi:hypothetical protein
MSEERIVGLLEEIRDLQNQQLEFSRENSRTYQEASKNHEKAVRRGRTGQIVFFALMLLFLLFVIYAEWFADGIPKPSWVK